MSNGKITQQGKVTPTGGIGGETGVGTISQQVGLRQTRFKRMQAIRRAAQQKREQQKQIRLADLARKEEKITIEGRQFSRSAVNLALAQIQREREGKRGSIIGAEDEGEARAAFAILVRDPRVLGASGVSFSALRQSQGVSLLEARQAIGIPFSQLRREQGVTLEQARAGLTGFKSNLVETTRAIDESAKGRIQGAGAGPVVIAPPQGPIIGAAGKITDFITKPISATEAEKRRLELEEIQGTKLIFETDPTKGAIPGTTDILAGQKTPERKTIEELREFKFAGPELITQRAADFETSRIEKVVSGQADILGTQLQADVTAGELTTKQAKEKFEREIGTLINVESAKAQTKLTQIQKEESIKSALGKSLFLTPVTFATGAALGAVSTAFPAAGAVATTAFGIKAVTDFPKIVTSFKETPAASSLSFFSFATGAGAGSLGFKSTGIKPFKLRERVPGLGGLSEAVRFKSFNVKVPRGQVGPRIGGKLSFAPGKLAVPRAGLVGKGTFPKLEVPRARLGTKAVRGLNVGLGKIGTQLETARLRRTALRGLKARDQPLDILAFRTTPRSKFARPDVLGKFPVKAAPKLSPKAISDLQFQLRSAQARLRSGADIVSIKVGPQGNIIRRVVKAPAKAKPSVLKTFPARKGLSPQVISELQFRLRSQQARIRSGADIVSLKIGPKGKVQRSIIDTTKTPQLDPFLRDVGLARGRIKTIVEQKLRQRGFGAQKIRELPVTKPTKSFKVMKFAEPTIPKGFKAVEGPGGLLQLVKVKQVQRQQPKLQLQQQPKLKLQQKQFQQSKQLFKQPALRTKQVAIQRQRLKFNVAQSLVFGTGALRFRQDQVALLKFAQPQRQFSKQAQLFKQPQKQVQQQFFAQPQLQFSKQVPRQRAAFAPAQVLPSRRLFNFPTAIDTRRRRRLRKVRRRTPGVRRSPSLVALGLGITAPTRAAGEFSGLNIRPIVTGPSFIKKKKKKKRRNLFSLFS